MGTGKDVGTGCAWQCSLHRQACEFGRGAAGSQRDDHGGRVGIWERQLSRTPSSNVGSRILSKRARRDLHASRSLYVMHTNQCYNSQAYHLSDPSSSSSRLACPFEDPSRRRLLAGRTGDPKFDDLPSSLSPEAEGRGRRGDRVMLSGAVGAGGESGSSRCSSGSSRSSGNGVGAKAGYGEGSIWKAAGVGADMSNVRLGRDEASDGSAARSEERRNVKSRPTSRRSCRQRCGSAGGPKGAVPRNMTRGACANSKRGVTYLAVVRCDDAHAFLGDPVRNGRCVDLSAEHVCKGLDLFLRPRDEALSSARTQWDDTQPTRRHLVLLESRHVPVARVS